MSRAYRAHADTQLLEHEPPGAAPVKPLPAVLDLRQARAERLLAIDERVGELITALKERGFESPYLRNFVVARIRPFRPRGKPAPEPDELLEHMEKAAEAFDAGKIKADHVARSAGGPE